MSVTPTRFAGRSAASLMLRGVGFVMTQVNKLRHAGQSNRKLEIGPGGTRLEGFETLNILPGRNVDYLWDATKKLPFSDSTFTLIYASHILEHVPWYQVESVMTEWVRVLAPRGSLEIWVPDGLKICKAFVDAELNERNYIEEDGWYRFNPEKDVCKWASGRLFTYGDGTGSPGHPNWHRGLFSPRYLHHVMEKAGLENVRPLERQEVRGYDHGWINLGATGNKK
jgi:SAM-dependent methyltransferase